MIYMLWKERMSQKFHQHICKEKKNLYQNGKNVLQLKVLEIITNFLSENEENYKDLRNNLSSYKNILQYVYSNVFWEIYCSTECCGFDLKSNFHIVFKTYKGKKKLEASLGKNPNNYMGIRNETYVYEQKPIKVDGFHEIEEEEVKEWVEKQHERREVADNDKLKKKTKKKQEDKEKEKAMWKRIGELNQEFRDIKEYKSKKISKSILKV